MIFSWRRILGLGLVLGLIFSGGEVNLFAWEEIWYLKNSLRKARKPSKETWPSEEIYLKDKAVFCTGTGKAARVNNRAAELILKGEYRKAEKILDAALKERSLFFPFRYNLGVCHLYHNELKLSHLHFTKARQAIPVYWISYMQLGYIYERWNRDAEAVESFRQALRLNKRDINIYVRIGDIFFKRNQLEMARKYYDASLKLEHRYPNGLLGLAKIDFRRGKYLRAINRLKTINTRRPYDRALHYYYGEAAFKLRDYKKAAEQYRILLKYKNDRFFLTTSPVLIKHKLYVSSQFVR